VQQGDRAEVNQLSRQKCLQQHRCPRPSIYEFLHPGDANPSMKKMIAKRAVFRVAEPAPASFQPAAEKLKTMMLTFVATAKRINLLRMFS
jgi:hypothetical protein